MKLTGDPIDLGLRTARLEPMVQFWRDDIGLEFSDLRKVREGQEQHRYRANGSLLKINHHADGLERHRPAGYQEIILVDGAVSSPRHEEDPEGVTVTLAPAGYEGVSQLGVRIGVGDLDAHRRFYTNVLGLAEARPGVFLAGDSLIFLEQNGSASRDAEMYGPGFRYITFVLRDGVAEHERMVTAGAIEGWAPMVANTATVVSVSMVRDPDGNWIELLERP